MYKRLHVSGIAPAKRGVPVLLHVFAVEIISIHAPCGGGPASSSTWSYTTIYFNSRPRVGAGPGDDTETPVSAYFNSRPRVGAGVPG